MLPSTVDTRLTRMQVAQMLRVAPKTLAAWEKAGRIPAPQRDWRGWRLYDGAVIHAIRAELGLPPPEAAPPTTLTTKDAAMSEAPPDMQISARNQLRGVVKSVTGDDVLCEVTLDLGGGHEVVSVITRSSAERLGLEPGVEATALIKSTEVLLAR